MMRLLCIIIIMQLTMGFSPAIKRHYSMDWLEQNDPFTGTPEIRNVRLPSKRWLDLCSTVGCQTRTMVFMSPEMKDRVAGFFSTVQNPVDERKAIAIAIAYLERQTCPRTATCKDRPDVSLFTSRFGQLDCVDEATNTTSYLIWFKLQGYLKFYVPEPPIFVRGIHWTATMREGQNGRRCIIESDFNATGQKPTITCGD